VSSIIPRSSPIALSVLNSTLGNKTPAQAKASVAQIEQDSKSSNNDVKGDVFQPADTSEDKLINAAKAYLKTADLVNVLRANKQANTLQSGQTPDKINASGGNDLIVAHSRTTIDAGNGNDVVTAFGGGQINAGNGDDFITTHSNAQINGGAGSDTITSFGSYSQVNAGAGNDRISSYGFSQVNAGTGDDFITAFGNGLVNGQDGNDIIASYGAFAEVDGGDGDDQITASAFTTVTGGKGDDTITTIGAGISFNFNKGDGRDEIKSANDISITLGEGISFEDVNISSKYGETIISLNGSSDQLTLNLTNGAKANLTFANGETKAV